MSALDIEETSNSLFGNIKKKSEKAEVEVNDGLKRNEKDETSSKAIPKDNEAKWKKLESVSVLLEPGQKESLNEVVKRLLKHRAQSTRGADKERISANMLIRALIDDFLDKKDSLPLEVLLNEEEVRRWVKSLNQR